MIIDFPVLESIKDLQSQHGLKYENYRRYRSYCSRRLHRLRRSLNVHQGVASSAKARHQRGRKLMDISNSMVLEAGEKNQDYGERMVMIPLCLSERAWSYAMQLKQETAEHPRRRYHLARRLKKASEHAQRFKKLVHDPESPCTDRTKQEATAYSAYITGLYEVEREVWDAAKDNLSTALAIYFKLSVSIKKDDVLEHYRQRMDELRASLRYCTFNLGQESRKQVDVELPGVLKFHDIAFRHVQQLEQELALAAKKSEPEKEVTPMEEEPVKAETIEVIPDDNEDEFEETQDGVEGESEEEEEEEDADKKKQSNQRAGGVTGLVKNWLGGAWS